MIDKTRLIVSLYLTLAASGAILTAAADEAPDPTPGATIYTQENFAQYAPHTALEMVERIPGFAIQGDNSNQRGFGQAQGNVLINGQRVSGKSNGAIDALRRIPVTSVIRIELVDGSRFEIPGLSGQIVNVITNGKGETSGTWSWRSRFRDNLPPFYNEFNVSLSGGKGALGWSLEVDSSPQRGANNGPEYITDGSGALIETRLEDFTSVAEEASVSGSLSWKPASGAIGNLNGTVMIWEPDLKEVSKTFPVGGTEGRRLFQESEDEWNAEIGADYEFDLGPGRLKGIGLIRRENSPILSDFRSGNIDGTNVSQSIFDRTIDEGEYILRGEYALGTGSGHDWQFALEGAFNYLDATSSLFTSENGGPLIEQDLGNANNRVEEQRAEFAITRGWKLSETLTTQVSLGAEYSELSQSGDTSNVRTFTRPKGYASLSWQADDSLKIVTRLEREVGQLDFFDFISSVNINSGNGKEGNSEIVPDQSWKLSVKAEKDFGGWGAATLEVFAADIEDIIDQIPIGTGDGPGNLDTAWQVGGELDATLKLDKAGLAGTEITFFGEYYDSEVKDPLTGEKRPINGDLIYYYNTEIRRDIPNTNWAIGAFFENYMANRYYQLQETGEDSAEPGYSSIFVEHKDLWGMTGRFSIGNLSNQKERFWRRIHDGNRLDPVLREEDRVRDFGPIISFQLEGKF